MSSCRGSGLTNKETDPPGGLMTDTTTTAVTKLANVIIPVADQDEALEFYTDVLGLEKRADVPFTEDGGRWIEVAPSGAETAIALCPPGQDAPAGNRQTGIGLETGDIDAYHAYLKAHGADVD